MSKLKGVSRRSAIQSFLALAGAAALPINANAINPEEGINIARLEAQEKTQIKITKLETFLVKPRWIFFKNSYRCRCGRFG